MVAMTTHREAVLDRIADRRDRMETFLADLVAAESTPGREAVAQDVVIEKLGSLGLDVDVWEPAVERVRDHPAFFETTTFREHGYQGRPNVAATIAGAGDGPSLALSGHVDVVPVGDPDEWTYHPWEPTVEDGRMYGRGTADMKGGIAAWVHAVETLLELDVDLRGDLILQTTIEEEAGGIGGVLSALDRGYQPDGAIVAEPAGPPTIGIASAGVLYFRLTVPGKPAHTARKFQGVDAVGKAYELYNALEELDRERKQRYPDYDPALRQTPDAAGNVTNLAITSFDAGEWTSTVPGEATMEFRVGWPPNLDETRADVREEIRGTIESVVAGDEWLSENPPELEWFGWQTNPHEVDTGSAFVRTVAAASETLTGEPAAFRGGLGGNDERFYNRYYDIPAVSVGPAGGRGHGIDEYVDRDSLVSTAQVHALAAMEWCGVDA